MNIRVSKPSLRRTLQVFRAIIGYTALAVAVTVGGVVIGATVVAPIVSRGTVSPSEWMPGLKVFAAGAFSLLQQRTLTLAADVLVFLQTTNAWPRSVWLAIGVGAAVVVLTVLIWGIRRRLSLKAESKVGGVFDRTAASGHSRSGSTSRSGRTPRAVLALAEAGTEPADIARRTGLPLDAVVLCLSMSSLGARQLQPPTA